MRRLIPVGVTWTVLLLCGGGAGCQEYAVGSSGYCAGEAVPCRERVVNCDSQAGCQLVDACGGQPLPCEVFYSTILCNHHSGCAYREHCTGVPVPCESIEAGAACDQQLGCDWSSTGMTCTGQPVQCSSFDVEICQIQDGCFVDDGCVGEPQPCWKKPASLCFQQAGCVLTEACDGQVTPCGMLRGEVRCNSQSGCRWLEI